MKLNELGRGEGARVVSVNEHSDSAAALGGFGFRPGAPVTMLAVYGRFYIIALYQGYVALDYDSCNNITVSPL